MGERLAEKISRPVEALARHGEKAVERWKRAGQGSQTILLAVEETRFSSLETGRQIGEHRLELGLHRNRHLGRTCGCRRAAVSGVVDQRPVGLVADGGNERDIGCRRGTHHDLVIEAPKILEAAAATGDDDEIGAGDRAAFRQCIETVDGVGHFHAAAFALHPHGPDDDSQREAIGDAVEDVADDRARGRRHHADHARHIGEKLLAPLVEQTFASKLLATFLKQRHQRAGAGRLYLLNDDLVARLAREGGELAGGNHFKTLFRLELPARHNALPRHCREDRLVVLEVEIEVTRTRSAQPAHLTTHAHMTEGILHRAAECAGKFGDRELGCVGGRFVKHRHEEDFRMFTTLRSSRETFTARAFGDGSASCHIYYWSFFAYRAAKLRENKIFPSNNTGNSYDP